MKRDEKEIVKLIERKKLESAALKKILRAIRSGSKTAESDPSALKKRGSDPASK